MAEAEQDVRAASVNASTVDLFSVLRRAHHHIDDLLAELERGSDSRGHALTEVSDRLIAALTRHVTGVERVIHPLVRATSQDAERAVSDQSARNIAVLKTLKDLEAGSRGDHRRASPGRTVTAVRSAYAEHVQGEEELCRPLLDNLASADRQRVGTEVLEAVHRAPDHPHPVAARYPGISRVADRLNKTIDRVRDATDPRSVQRRH